MKEDLDDAEWGESTSCKTRSGAVRSFSKSRLVRLLGGGVLLAAGASAKKVAF